MAGCAQAPGDGTDEPKPVGNSAMQRSNEVPTAAAEAPPVPTSADAGVPQATADAGADPWPAALAGTHVETVGDRIYSKVRMLWIHPRPIPSKAWIGYLSLGDSVPVRGGRAAEARIDDGATDGKGCQQWYAVEPRGYVCVGGQATLDQDDPLVVELGKTAADRSSPWPYRYGESLYTPVYPHVPDGAEQARTEPDLQQHLERLRQARQAPASTALATAAPALLGVPLEPSGEPPPAPIELHPLGRAIQTRVFPGSTVAYTRRFDQGDRTWLLTWDRGVVPQDRVRPFARSHFAGVVLGEHQSLPLAFFRERARPKYQLGADGGVEPTGASWPRHGWVGLTGREKVAGSRRFLETTERGHYCAADDATSVERATTLPALVAQRTDGRRTWLDISVLGGWLVAYEAERPVYATLISPGRGGVPFRGVPPIDTASTPVGQFRVTGKFLTATMVSSSDANVVHAEVQYTQNFSGPHALHGAYWHDDWGEKKSGGCVNLSPIDARRIFAWTEPPLPAGWHGVRWLPSSGESTVLAIHR